MERYINQLSRQKDPWKNNSAVGKNLSFSHQFTAFFINRKEDKIRRIHSKVFLYNVKMEQGIKLQILMNYNPCLLYYILSYCMT
jgi:hypothetical protein